MWDFFFPGSNIGTYIQDSGFGYYTSQVSWLQTTETNSG